MSAILIKMKRKCSVCKKIKTLREFCKDRRRKSGRAYQCYVCARKYMKMYHRKNQGKRREYKLKFFYGLSIDAYESKLKEQKGVCAICKHSDVRKQSLSVDHNHVTGEVRGLLCSNCNHGIGCLQDSTFVLAEALTYLKTHSEDKIIEQYEKEMQN